MISERVIEESMGAITLPKRGGRRERFTKKDQILSLYRQGVSNVNQISQVTGASSSYVAQVHQSEGLLSGYFDLYTSNNREQNVYSQQFRNVLSFKDCQAARESLKKIDRLYNFFERVGDRTGQHHAMVVALTGMNRARFSGKTAESELFREWLMSK
jgi:hypothetical protein